MNFLIGLVLALASLFATCTGTATTVRPLDLSDLAQQAEVIADVTVTGTESFWASPAAGKLIHTRVTLSLNSAPLKGQVTSPFTLDFLGGSVGNRTMEVSGMPKLQTGDRLIIFSHGPDQIFVSPLIGFDQGVLRVIKDKVANVDRVYRWWGQAVNESESFTSRTPSTAAITSAEEPRPSNSVDEFLQRVSKMLHQ